MNFKFEETAIPKPQHVFLVNMSFGQTNEEIKFLQNVLKYEGLFPTNVESTGYYGPVTQKAVGQFQIKHKVVDNETSPGYGIAGPKTREKLNLLYN
jgi:peptidoglycan hydrolase-like protein with peptidoglycan-binding domain